MTQITTLADHCGTVAGYQQHVRAGEPACGPCRQAHRDYRRAWRASDQERRIDERRRNRARGRALWALARLHHDEFTALYVAELDQP